MRRQSGRLKLSKMPEGIDFPYHFGFIPGTLAEDGDLMDVLVLIDELNFSGCEGDCTMVGVMQGGTEDEATEELSE